MAEFIHAQSTESKIIDRLARQRLFCDMIIWGSKARETKVGSGSFFCPNCKTDSTYSQLKISRYFTLYFIPLFPTATLGKVVTCDKCKQQYPDVILQCSREEILQAIEPWPCSKCGNRNPSSEKTCLNCGAPPTPPTAPPSPSRPPPLMNPPPVLKPRSRSKTANWVGIAIIVLLIAGYCFFLAYNSTTPQKPTRASYFYDATSRIGPMGETAVGNSSAASKLAEQLAAVMTQIRAEQFSESTKKSLLDAHDTFKVFCDLRETQCVFLVHVPELRRFNREAQTALGNSAWLAAWKILNDSDFGKTNLQLTVGIRGAISYDRVILGQYVSGTSPEGTPEVVQGFGCEQRLIDVLAIPEPTANVSTPVNQVQTSTNF